MFQDIPVHEGNIFTYRVTGRFSHADYEGFLPEIEMLRALVRRQ